MAANHGKRFESIVQKGLEQLSYVSIDRIRDPNSGYRNIRNFCDFMLYRKPNLYYLECKVVIGNTLNFKSRISQDQWEGLYQKAAIEGVGAGILVWFIDHDVTYYFDIRLLHSLESQGANSINATALPLAPLRFFQLNAKKKRVFFQYDMIDFTKKLEDMYKWQE